MTTGVPEEWEKAYDAAEAEEEAALAASPIDESPCTCTPRTLGDGTISCPRETDCYERWLRAKVVVS